MTINSKTFEFLSEKVIRLLSPADLKLPETPADHVKAPSQNILPGDEFMVYVEDKSVCGHYVAKEWTNGSPNAPRKLVLVDNEYQVPLWLSSWQIDWLSMQGRIRTVHQSPRPHSKVELPDNPLGLTEYQSRHAHRLLAYVDHYRDLCIKENRGQPSVALMNRARDEVAAKRGERPLGKTAIHEAMVKLRDRRNMDRVCAVAPLPNNGNPGGRLGEKLEEAVQKAVRIAWTVPKGTWLQVKAQLEKLCDAEDGEYSELAEEAKNVSKSTLQRRFAGVDLYTRTFLRYGEEEANRINAMYMRIARPGHPLDVVDIDHTALNVVVYDELVPVSFGRPDIIVFRDRHSGAVIGFHIGFEAPSFAGFLAGLKHTVYPKDPQSLPPKMKWPWYGMPVRLGVDQASHFVGGDMENAQRELGFQVIEYRPGRPWEKGATEKLFSILGMKMIHSLPGATGATPDERKKFDEDAEKAKPAISIQELYGFLAYYFAEVHNRSLTAGIGPLITLKDTPAKLWAEGIPHATMRPLIDPAVFTRLVGYTQEVTIQADGIRINYLHYMSAELIALRSHPKHKMGSHKAAIGKHSATKYTATIDPNDLGRIWVRDPYRKVMIEVPIMDMEKRYANGLSLYQHKKIVEYHLKESGDAPGVGELTEARRKLELMLGDMHAKRRQHNTAMKLARFLTGQAAKIRGSEVVELAPNGSVSTHIDYAQPEVQTPEAKLSTRGRGLMPGDDHTTVVEVAEQTPPEAESPPEPAVADIETLKERHKGWED